jgi:hypothetical protein
MYFVRIKVVRIWRGGDPDRFSQESYALLIIGVVPWEEDERG